LNNIIENAINFTDKGSIVLTAEGEDNLVIRISDTGIGMSEENLIKVLDTFTQVESQFTRSYGGLGIGLSIANSIVNLMNGEFNIISERNKGTTVTVTLPGSLPGEPRNSRGPEDIPENILNDKNVLVVEDEIISMYYLTNLLKNLAGSIIKAFDGQQAIDIVKSKAADIDLVFMDISMPIMDGLMATKIIREEYHYSKPVIAVTAHAFEEDKKRFIESGMNDVLIKPFNKADLLSKLNAVLSEE
jgi:CheY-like chemotaxis protein